MRTPEQIVKEAKQTGKLWLGGEMEIPYLCTWADAWEQMNGIAEACGYVVTTQGTTSQLHIVGGEIPGEIVLDWFVPGKLGPEKVSLWTEEFAYLGPVAA